MDIKTLLKKTVSSRITLYVIVFTALYFVLPVFLSHFVSYSRRIGVYLFFFYALNTTVVIFILKSFALKGSNLVIKTQDLSEAMNVLENEKNRQVSNQDALKRKIKRYIGLKEIIEEINRTLDLDFVANKLTDIAFSMIAHEKGSCILYMTDSKSQKLVLFKTRKEDKRLVIKEKEGDIFDFWVVRHTSPLLVEDVHKDFRFDLERLSQDASRPVRSLICAPFISEHNFIGILRLESPEINAFTQDDLRFLVTICDLGAIALENSELFRKTQELATHDGLTGLYTKGFFRDRLKEDCRRAQRGGFTLSLLMLDIDHFKNYNDKFGHTSGDIVLQKISRILQDSFKDTDAVIGRFGGEEFCIALLRADKEQAKVFAEKLRERIAQEKIILRRVETKLTISIGVASLPVDAGDEEELILKADKALLEAKKKGRNRVVCV